MSAGSVHSEVAYEVVVNQEGQYSIWPTSRIVPNGWSITGKQGSKESCLEFISEAWTDMRPLSLRVRAHSS